MCPGFSGDLWVFYLSNYRVSSLQSKELQTVETHIAT